MKISIEKEEYDRLLNEIRQKDEHISLLQKLLFGSKSDRISKKEKDPCELDLWDNHPDSIQATVNFETKKLNSKKRKKRKPEENRKALPEHLERIVEKIELPSDKCTCDVCGDELVEIGQEVTEELEYIPAKFRVKEITRVKYACPKDSLHGVYRARLPERIIPKGIAGASLLFHILVSKYIDHLPLERLHNIFKREGINVPKTTMSDWMGKVCKKLEPLLDCLKQKVLASRIINADETTFKVQENSKKKGLTTGYLWTFVGDKNWVWFNWNPSRSQTVPAEILTGFEGDYLQCDGYSGYNQILKNRNITNVGCWAHARRKFVEAYDAGYLIAESIIDKISKLYDVEAAIRAREKNENIKNYTAHEIKKIRGEYSIPILKDIRQEIDELLESALPKGKLGIAITYIKNQWDSLVVYCQDGDLQIDNNMVERAIRPVALGRKNYLFAGSPNGAQWAASFYSLIETCKLHGVNPANYLTEVLQYISDYDGEDMETLLPDAYALRVSQK